MALQSEGVEFKHHTLHLGVSSRQYALSFLIVLKIWADIYLREFNELIVNTTNIAYDTQLSLKDNYCHYRNVSSRIKNSIGIWLSLTLCSPFQGQQ